MCGVSTDCLALGVARTGILEEAGRLGSVPTENGMEASKRGVALTFSAPTHSLRLGDCDYRRGRPEAAPPSLPQQQNKAMTFKYSDRDVQLKVTKHTSNLIH